MKHLDLFSGIGGAALAVDAVWPGTEHIFCEIDTYCQALLHKRFPNSKIHGDIRTLTNTRCEHAHNSQDEQELESEGGGQSGIEQSRNMGRVDILTAGVPCQPASQAGRRKGKSDDRWLWEETFGIIRHTQPRWVILENVRGLVTLEHGVVFQELLASVEKLGYEYEAFIIPAVAVNAPHRRDRIWIVAHRTGTRTGGDNGGLREISIGNRGGQTATTPDTGSIESGRLSSGEREEIPKTRKSDKDASDTRQQYEPRDDEGMETSKTERSSRIIPAERSDSWNQNWLEVATRLCGVFNGLSEGLDKVMSDGIYLKYAKTFNKVAGQDLPHLWQGFQSQSFQWNLGRFDPIQDKDYLFTILWKLAHRTERQNNPPFESAEVQRAYMRNLWNTEETGCPSQGWKYQEQYAEEHKDTLSSLSYEVALAASEIKKAYNKDRTERLKGLGNAWVPQVAIEIMKAIKQVDAPHGKTKT